MFLIQVLQTDEGRWNAIPMTASSTKGTAAAVPPRLVSLDELTCHFPVALPVCPPPDLLRVFGFMGIDVKDNQPSVATLVAVKVVEDSRFYVAAHFPMHGKSVSSGPVPKPSDTAHVFAAFYNGRDIARLYYKVECLWEHWSRFWLNDVLEAMRARLVHDLRLQTTAAAAVAAAAPSSVPSRKSLTTGSHKQQSRSSRLLRRTTKKATAPGADTDGKEHYSLADKEKAMQSLRLVGHVKIPLIVNKWAFELGLISVDPAAVKEGGLEEGATAPGRSSSSTLLSLEQIYRSCHVVRLQSDEAARAEVLLSFCFDGSSTLAPLPQLTTRPWRSWLLDSSPLRSCESMPESTEDWRRHERIHQSDQRANVHLGDLIRGELLASQLTRRRQRIKKGGINGSGEPHDGASDDDDGSDDEDEDGDGPAAAAAASTQPATRGDNVAFDPVIMAQLEDALRRFVLNSS